MNSLPPALFEAWGREARERGEARALPEGFEASPAQVQAFLDGYDAIRKPKLTPFGRILKRLGYSRAEAARVLRVPPRTIERWAQDRSEPSRAVIRLLIARRKTNRP